MRQFTRKVLGLTGYIERAQFLSWDRDCFIIPLSYTEMFVDTEIVPFGILPPANFDEVVLSGPKSELSSFSLKVRDRADRLTDFLSALIIIGGNDIDPSLYNVRAHETVKNINTARDLWEICLILNAKEKLLPVVGICRGHQLLNVAFGGTLIQHLPDTVEDLEHQIDSGSFCDTSIRTVPNSQVAGIFGSQLHVKCSHHQAVNKVADGFVVSAFSEENIVEAIEWTGDNWKALGIQWHPEETREKRIVKWLESAMEEYCGIL